MDATAGPKPESPHAPDGTRRMLLAATGAVGGAGIVAAAYPFVASLEPSERARALGGPVEATFNDLREGELKTVAWRGQPVWIVHRSAEMVRSLERSNPVLADPRSERSTQPPYCKNPLRSRRPDVFVAIGICTHLGCSPKLTLHDETFDARTHADGGFLCPCHGSRFDLAGRVVKDVPAPTNLVIPDYTFGGPALLTIGT